MYYDRNDFTLAFGWRFFRTIFLVSLGLGLMEFNLHLRWSTVFSTISEICKLGFLHILIP